LDGEAAAFEDLVVEAVEGLVGRRLLVELNVPEPGKYC